MHGGTERRSMTALSAGDNPEAYLPGDRRRSLASGDTLADRVRGAALFADISGFTALTEALAGELGPQRGAEELTAQLNRVFHAVIAEIDRYGGDVIYFSGDAITCWLDGDDGARAAAAALGVQRVMAEVRTVTTPGGQTFQLAMKVAVATGAARRFVVGDPDIQLIDVLAGALIDDLAAAEHEANEGEIVLDASAVDALEGRVRLQVVRTGDDGRTYGVLEGLTVDVPQMPPAEPARPLREDEVRPWLLPSVYERLREGRGEFLAELRPAIPLFLRFGGIDYDANGNAIEELDKLIRGAQHILRTFGGHALQLTIGDKGTYLYAVFGAPLAHEDDAARAATAAIDLLGLERTTAGRDFQIGIAQGRLRSGTYGHALRRTYCCLGDAVNLAARLMTVAEPGQIVVSEGIRRATGNAFAWEPLGDLRVKGKSVPVRAHALNGRRTSVKNRQALHHAPLVGRGRELALLARRFADVEAGAGRIVVVDGEAGLGKSRLLAEAVALARARGLRIHSGECQAFGAHTSYFPWQEIWAGLLDVDRTADVPEQLGMLERSLAGIDEALLPRLPLLGTVLGLPIPDTELTGGLDAKVRKASLEALLGDCLRAVAAQGPLVLVLEDCHWIDPLSRDLLASLARVVAALPALVLVAHRPSERGEDLLGLARLPHFSRLPLTALPPDDAELLVRAKTGELFDDVAPPQELVELVVARSQGNPFYIEELLNYLRNQGVDPRDRQALRGLELPDSLHTLVLSRIDTLPEAPRRTLKVASVLGRTFRAPMLLRVYPELGAVDAVGKSLALLREHDFVTADGPDDEGVHLFRHVVIQEVAYESMPFAIRATLHGAAGRAIESTDETERNLDLLAHHYWHADDEAKKREYLLRAGDAAQGRYANEAAVDYFRRLAPLLDHTERWPLLLKLGGVLELIGEWPEAEAVYGEALVLAEAAGDAAGTARAHTALGEVARKQARYEEAESCLERAGAVFAELGDEEGSGRVLHLLGTLAAQHGDYDAARSSYQQSLEIRRRLDDRAAMGALYTNLGIVAEYTGDYEEARRLQEQSLALREEVGDRWNLANAQNNLGNIARLQGDHAEARARLEDALRIQIEVGDLWSVALVQNNLGNVVRDQGDLGAAAALYAEALAGYRDRGDKWSLAFLLEDLAAFAATSGDAEPALQLAAAAEALRTEIGVPRAPGDTEQLERLLAPARAALPEDAQAAAWTAGHALDLAAAIDRAFAVCSGFLAGDRLEIPA